MQIPTSSSGPDSQAAVFDVTAGQYDEELNKGISITGETKEYFAEQRLAWVAQRMAALGIHPRSALDFGCGTGGATPYFFSAFPSLERLVGLDPSPSSLKVAQAAAQRQGLNAQFFASAAEALAVSPPVDFAFCNGVFHHIPLTSRATALAEVRALLTPGAWFAFSENNPWNPMMRYAMSRISFDKDAILIRPGPARRLLRSAGLTVHWTDFLFFLPKMFGRLRTFERRLEKVPLEIGRASCRERV